MSRLRGWFIGVDSDSPTNRAVRYCLALLFSLEHGLNWRMRSVASS